MEGLIGFVNRIQTACTAVGDLGSLSSTRDALPSVAVVGGQSSGKSSVLEGIVGKDFLPRGSGMVTRRPLVLQLCKIDAYQQEYAEFSHLPGRKFTDFCMVRKEIWDETNRIPGKTKQISFVPIRLTIHSPHVVNLILIDLPGLTKVAVEGQSESIVQDTESMVRSYIEKPNSIILAIIPANQDIGTSDAIKIAREVDPTGERTLGVLTKLDLTDKVTNALDVLEGRSYRLQHPWVGIVNRSQADINKNVDMVVARRREQEYFATSPYYRHLAPRMGSKYLAKLISRVVELKKEKEEMIENLKLAGGVVGGIAAVAFAGWGLSKMGLSDDGGESSKREEKKKMMKAPGRDIYIPRDEFEDNPSAYFSNLRQKREEEKRKMMKAPGRDIYIPRDEFEDNPSAYFSNLRQKREEEEEKKMMKAPGRGIYIPRDEFEDNPSAYFSNLRQKREEEEEKKMMKAPGRGIYIPRDGFEDNPSAYFHNLRQKTEEEEKKKMMKAPGRDIYIPRDEFEDNPSAYFHNLRQKREEEEKKMMKAPGRGTYIPRDGFEDNPRAYFRNLRQKD